MYWMLFLVVPIVTENSLFDGEGMISSGLENCLEKFIYCEI